MNLHAVSPDPKVCSKWLDTKRLGWVGVKESAQLIATALHELYGVETPVKPSHKNHPVAVWVRSKPSNLWWAIRYMGECQHEYYNRKDKEYHVNKISSDILTLNFIQEFKKRNNYFDISKPTSFCNCACRKDLGIDYRHITNVHDAYRMYLAHRWMTDKRIPTWK